MNTLQRLFAFMFGDGGIENPNASRPGWFGSNCRLRFTHGANQEAYLKWKVIEIERLGFRCARFDVKDVRYNKAGSKHDGKTYRSAIAVFTSDRLFTEAYRIIYPNGRGGKMYSARWVNGETLDDYAMAVWWMDDGSIHYRRKIPTDKICGYLNTCSDEQESLLLKILFESKLNTEIKLHKKKDKFVLYFPHIAYRRLLMRVAPYIHDTMWYKCSIVRGEDGSPIIPTSAEHLRKQMKI